MRGAIGFTKGLIAGSILGGAIGLMVNPPDAATMRKIRRKTKRAVRNMGCMMEDFVNGR